MESILGLIVAGLCCTLLVITTQWWDLKKENKQLNDDLQELRREEKTVNVKSESTSQKNLGTRDLFLKVLTSIGCQYQLGEGEDNRIFFAYQGEHFFADTTNDIKYVHLWDTHWGHVDLYDIDEVCRFRKAINLSNLNTSVTTVFTIDEDGKNMDIHSKSTIPFLSSMPDLDDYLRVELNDFFRAHQVVGNEMNKLREKEHKA